MPESFSLTAFQNGSKTAFNYIFELYYKRLHFFSTGISTEIDAEDIVQESFIKLWERKESFNNPESIKAFLYLTTKNACLNALKHLQVVNKFNEIPQNVIDELNIANKLIEAEVLNEVQQALFKLPLGYRRVIYLNYFKGMSNQEVAAHLNLSVNTIKTQKIRGLKILKTMLNHSAILAMIFLSSK